MDASVNSCQSTYQNYEPAALDIHYRLAVLTNMLQRRTIAPFHSDRCDVVALNMLQPVIPFERFGRDYGPGVIMSKELTFLPPTGVALFIGGRLWARTVNTANVLSQGVKVV